MKDPNANYPAELTRTQASADTVDETEISTGTLEAAFAITSPPARLTQIEVGQRLDDFDLLVDQTDEHGWHLGQGIRAGLHAHTIA